MNGFCAEVITTCKPETMARLADRIKRVCLP
jgi:hypothetical protein